MLATGMMRSKLRRALWALTGVAIILVLLGLSWRSAAWATPPAPGAAAPAAAPQSGAGVAGAAAVAPAPPPSDPTKATIIFQTVPPANAIVFWGRTRLGRIKPQRPLVVVRPRDSGPLDVVIRAEGFLPVQTRAHTFGDTRLAVKLTRVEEKSTLFGYRAPLDDAGVPLVPDGGVPDALSGMPSSLTQPSIAPVTEPPATAPLPMSTPAPEQLPPATTPAPPR
jgi:hypothetical protein